jgi:LysM repeat protein
MTDDASDNKPKTPRRPSSDAARRRKPAASDGQQAMPEERPPSGGDLTDPSAALGRLEAMSRGGPAGAPPPGSPPRPQRSAVPVATSASRRPRPRPAASADTGRKVARIAAPAVFLVAVIVLIAITFQSGVIGGSSKPAGTPTPVATQTQAAFKTYRVKSGDTWSGIAVKFNTTTDVLQAANPSLSTTTLIVGEKIRVPRQ